MTSHMKFSYTNIDQGDDTKQSGPKATKQQCGKNGGMMYGDTSAPWDPDEATLDRLI